MHYLKKNYHTHTIRCHHAVGSEREYVEAAIKSGMDTLGFSDHIPMETGNRQIDGVRMSYAQVEDYVDSVLRLQSEYKDDIAIYLGFEAEYFPSEFERQRQLLEQYPFDYVILGQHFLQTETTGVYTGRPTTERRVLEAYVDTCIEALDTGVYSYLCHPDLIGYEGTDAVWREEMTRLCRYCKKNGYPIELNLLGILEERHYPSEQFFALAGQIGNDVILGIDAHNPLHIGNADIYRQALCMARDCNVKIVDEIALLR